MFTEATVDDDDVQAAESTKSKSGIRTILYVSHTGRVGRPYYDPSVRYRCFNFAEFGRSFGIKTYVISQTELEQMPSVPEFDLYVFHRPKLTRGLLNLLEKLPKGAAKIADYDDLVFEVESAEHTSAVRSRNTPIWSVRNAISDNYGAFCLFDTFTVSTAPLRDAVLRLNHNATVTVLPNLPDRGYIGLARQLRRSRTTVRRRRIGYFSGTNSHNEDFELVGPAIAEFCASKGVEFFLMGPVQVPRSMNSDQFILTKSPVKSFQEMAMEIAICDFVIAPLAESEFTSCKSAIKFMESAVLGVPTVATPIPDIDRFESPILFKAKSVSDWPNCLDEAWNRDRADDSMAAAALDDQLSKQRSSFVTFLQSI